GKHKVTNRKLDINMALDKALINAFITSTQQGETGLPFSQCTRPALIEYIPSRGQQNSRRATLSLIATGRMNRSQRALQRRNLHHHAGSTAEAALIHAPIVIITVVPRIPGLQRQPLRAHSAADHAISLQLPNPIRKQPDNIHSAQKSKPQSTVMRPLSRSTRSTIGPTTSGIRRLQTPSTTITSLAPVSIRVLTRPSVAPLRLTTSSPIRSCQ